MVVIEFLINDIFVNNLPFSPISVNVVSRSLENTIKLQPHSSWRWQILPHWAVTQASVLTEVLDSTFMIL